MLVDSHVDVMPTRDGTLRGGTVEGTDRDGRREGTRKIFR
jgi:hypothetical protein